MIPGLMYLIFKNWVRSIDSRVWDLGDQDGTAKNECYCAALDSDPRNCTYVAQTGVQSKRFPHNTSKRAETEGMNSEVI